MVINGLTFRWSYKFGLASTTPAPKIAATQKLINCMNRILFLSGQDRVLKKSFFLLKILKIKNSKSKWEDSTNERIECIVEPVPQVSTFLAGFNRCFDRKATREQEFCSKARRAGWLYTWVIISYFSGFVDKGVYVWRDLIFWDEGCMIHVWESLMTSRALILTYVDSFFRLCV